MTLGITGNWWGSSGGGGGSQPDPPAWNGDPSEGSNAGEIVLPVTVAAGVRVYGFWRIGDSGWSAASLAFSVLGPGNITITDLDLGYEYELDILTKDGAIYSRSPGPKFLTLDAESAAATDNVPVAKRAMKQTAVYWPLLSKDSYGKPTYESAVEIDCRWDEVQEEFIGPDGTRQLSIAKLIVDRDLKVGGVVFLGGLDAVGDADDPKSNDGAWEIRGWKKTPNFKGTKFLREVYL